MRNTINLHARRFSRGDTVLASLRPVDTGQDGTVDWAIERVHRDGAAEPVRTGKLRYTAGDEVIPLRVDRLRTGSYRLTATWGGDVDDPTDQELFVVEERPIHRVELTKSGFDGPQPVPAASYRAFEAFVYDGVKALRGAGGAQAEAREFITPYDPANEPTYEELKRFADEYVRGLTCTSLDDLARPYLTERLANEPLAMPHLVGADRGPSDQIHTVMPCVELIWNYWLEEAMLVQTLNLILARFQNRIVPGYASLARFDVSPLVGLQELLYDFVDDDSHRMTLRRRAIQYLYEYGFQLIGRAVPSHDLAVERRSAFLGAFHEVLHQALHFYKEQDDMTVAADPFPLYQALREAHLVLSYGSHNQYGQMARRARAEFLVMQYLLARPQMREFLGGRPMTPYTEPWQDRLDTMKSLQPGWPQTSVMHFHDLATMGEILVLSIRLGSWADDGVGADEARDWAVGFRQPIQRYVAAYRAATGVDLFRTPDATMPSVLLQRRADEQRRRA